MTKILPLGSIVRLKKGIQKVMIICRAPLYNNQGNIGYFDYSACLYPIGQMDQQMFFFNDEDIEEIYFEGYSDEEEERFCELYEKAVSEIKYPKLHLQIEED